MRYRRKHARTQPRGWISLFIRFGGWVCFLFGFGLVVLTLFSASALYLADQLDAEMHHARAEVEGKRFLSEGAGDQINYVTFVYKSPRGVLHTEAEVTQRYFDSVAVGDSTVIRYARSDPGLITHEPEDYHRNGRILRGIGLAIGLIGLLSLWRFGSQTNHAIKARRDGEKRYAVLGAIKEDGVEKRGKAQARLIWREPDGQEGESLLHPLETLRDLYEAGDRIVVFRLGDKAYWEGDVGPPRREMRLK